jgi:hypothetical protein
MKRLTAHFIAACLMPIDGGYSGQWDRDATGRIWVASTEDGSGKPELRSYSDQEFYDEYGGEEAYEFAVENHPGMFYADAPVWETK